MEAYGVLMQRYRTLRFSRVYPGDPTDARALIDHVCRNLRSFDEEEALAVMGGGSVDQLAAYFIGCAMSASEFVIVSTDWEEPIALVSVLPSWPGLGAAQMVATDRFDEIVMDLTRYIRRELIPRLLAGGMRRVEARAMQKAELNCRWLKALGASVEGECPMFGKDGQTYVQFAWTKGSGLCV